MNKKKQWEREKSGGRGQIKERKELCTYICIGVHGHYASSVEENETRRSALPFQERLRSLIVIRR